MYSPKLGDWIRPTEPTIDGINYGYNLRLVIETPKDPEDDLKTTCEAFGEENIWNVFNSEFIARIELGE